MKILRPAFALPLAAALALAGAAQAADVQKAVSARQKVMSLLAYELGELGAMAKGQTPYDATAAKAAAGNLAALSSMDISSMFPAGSEMGKGPKTEAKPAIWQNKDDFLKHYAELHDASAALAASAGNGLDAVKAGMGKIGASCGACHKLYRG